MIIKSYLKLSFVLLLIITFFPIFSSSTLAVDCTRTVNGNVSITNTCSFPEPIDGVDSGTGSTNDAVLTLGQGASLTVLTDQQIAVGSITLSGGSITTINGSLKIGAPIYMIDQDGDGYPANTTQYLEDGTYRVRRNDLTSWTVDCDDVDPNVNEVCCADNGSACSSDGACCSNVCGTNTDGDSYFSSTAGHTGICYASALPYTDCNDGISTVWRTSGNCYPDWDMDGYTKANTDGGLCCTNGTTCATSTERSVCSDTYETSWPHAAGQLKDSANGDDCSHTDANVYVSGTCYYDADNDEYGVSGTTYNCLNNATCASATWGSVDTGTSYNYNFSSVDTDCCDTDNRAYPGATTCYSTQRTTCGGYDYNCDSAQSRCSFWASSSYSTQASQVWRQCSGGYCYTAPPPNDYFTAYTCSGSAVCGSTAYTCSDSKATTCVYSPCSLGTYKNSRVSSGTTTCR